jgi:CheY-like chemotaxis protein
LMGGQVGVDSTPGQGSRFWLQVQVQPVAAAADDLPSDAATPAAPTTTAAPTALATASTALPAEVLVVEDNPVNRMLVQTFLTQFGLRVCLAEDGQQALDLLTQGAAPALVLMDLQMPVMDGYTATEKIRAWETSQARPRLPILALTADAFEEDRQHCLAVGMDGFLTKPIAKQALLQALQTWLPCLRSPGAEAPQPAPAALDTAPYQALRNELTHLLQHHQYDALACFDRLALLLQGTALASQANALRPLLHDLQFDQALHQLQQWPDPTTVHIAETTPP